MLLNNSIRVYFIFLFIIFYNDYFLKSFADKIRWEVIRDKQGVNLNKKNKIKWEKFHPTNIYQESERDNIEKVFNSSLELEDKTIKTNEFLYLGFAVPNSFLMNRKDFMIYAEQLFPFYKGAFEKGTANQNYSIFISYGLSDRFMLMSFFSHSDDPLYNKINDIEKQPANKWVSFGLGSRLNILKKDKFLTSLDTSIESWYVKSGGSNGVGNEGSSSNIFDKSLNVFENINIIGSLALPTTFKISPNLNLVISPKISFLPGEQIYKNNSGSFYGLNSGIGLGFSYKLMERFSIYNSAYFPISGENYFDNNITFKQAIIYDFGFSYRIDPKISFQGYLSNSFGATPATGILTIPSDNNLIIGTRLIYQPTAIDIGEYSTNENENENKFDGLSVSNTNLIKTNKVLFDFEIQKGGDLWTTVTKGISRNFNFEISTGKSNKGSKITNENFDVFIDSNVQNLRFGGKVILIKENHTFPITSGFRMTFGRALGEEWPGYLFIENIITKNISNRIKLNITPKFAWNGEENPSAIGSSLMFDINNNYSLIIERNNALRKAENNFTSALRISNNKNRYFDFYITDAVNFNDIGELINANEISYGLKLGFKF